MENAWLFLEASETNDFYWTPGPFSRLKIMRLKPVQPPNERNGHTLLLLIQKILMLKSHALPFSIKILPGKPDEL